MLLAKKPRKDGMKLKSHEFENPILIANHQKYFNNMKNNKRQKKRMKQNAGVPTITAGGYRLNI